MVTQQGRDGGVVSPNALHQGGVPIGVWRVHRDAVDQQRLHLSGAASGGGGAELRGLIGRNVCGRFRFAQRAGSERRRDGRAQLAPSDPCARDGDFL